MEARINLAQLSLTEVYPIRNLPASLTFIRRAGRQFYPERVRRPSTHFVRWGW